MFIYIDESGSFAPSARTDSWNVVAAYVVPEVSRKHVENVLRNLKLALGRAYTDELRLKDLTESNVKYFISELAKSDCALFISAIDLGAQDPASIEVHQKSQVEKIRANIPRMIYEEGRRSIEDVAARVERLPLQLYTQMVAQIDLLDQVYRSTTLYYSQRIPATLGAFRWRVDEKNSNRPIYEQTMRHMAPPLLQSKSLRDPAVFVIGFDYSHYEKSFGYKQNEIPKYLQEETGIKIDSGSNLGRVLRDFSFVRSHDVPGVQVADLLASAYRRALRNEFQSNLEIASLLGSMTVQRAKQQPSIHLISLSDNQYASGQAFDVAMAARTTARKMLM